LPENISEVAAPQLIGIAIPTLRELRAATLSTRTTATKGEADAVDALREAGYAGGDAVYDAFERWLSETTQMGPPESESRTGPAADLSLDDFGDRIAQYFRAAGWGQLDFAPERDEGVATLTVENCWEVEPSADQEKPSCHVTTGMFAAFFGRVAGYPVAVLETECCSAGADRCRFLLGNTEVMTFKWEQLG
jgi:predicted hydrocarbon binding protein